MKCFLFPFLLLFFSGRLITRRWMWMGIRWFSCWGEVVREQTNSREKMQKNWNRCWYLQSIRKRKPFFGQPFFTATKVQHFMLASLPVTAKVSAIQSHDEGTDLSLVPLIVLYPSSSPIIISTLSPNGRLTKPRKKYNWTRPRVCVV